MAKKKVSRSELFHKSHKFGEPNEEINVHYLLENLKGERIPDGSRAAHPKALTGCSYSVVVVAAAAWVALASPVSHSVTTPLSQLSTFQKLNETNKTRIKWGWVYSPLGLYSDQLQSDPELPMSSAALSSPPPSSKMPKPSPMRIFPNELPSPGPDSTSQTPKTPYKSS
ncbi:hypothetical protein ACH5RR_012094 [Cinchona calisaya]|uniref:Uncharacterized protein n=1 Tax=Cinchona calisaya TaxID=153742 RepID=A0ABD3A8C8_9GENT